MFFAILLRETLFFLPVCSVEDKFFSTWGILLIPDPYLEIQNQNDGVVSPESAPVYLSCLIHCFKATQKEITSQIDQSFVGLSSKTYV